MDPDALSGRVEVLRRAPRVFAPACASRRLPPEPSPAFASGDAKLFKFPRLALAAGAAEALQRRASSDETSADSRPCQRSLPEGFSSKREERSK